MFKSLFLIALFSLSISGFAAQSKNKKSSSLIDSAQENIRDKGIKLYHPTKNNNYQWPITNNK